MALRASKLTYGNQRGGRLLQGGCQGNSLYRLMRAKRSRVGCSRQVGPI